MTEITTTDSRQEILDGLLGKALAAFKEHEVLTVREGMFRMAATIEVCVEHTVEKWLVGQDDTVLAELFSAVSHLPLEGIWWTAFWQVRFYGGCETTGQTQWKLWLCAISSYLDRRLRQEHPEVLELSNIRYGRREALVAAAS